jgi:hypothetical protein
MKKTSQQLKCACVHCDEFINYSFEEAGQIAECPNCKQKSLLPPPPESANQGTRPPRVPSRTMSVRWVVIGAVGLLVAGALVVLPRLRHRDPTPAAADAQTLPTVLPEPTFKRPRSLNDLKIGSFSLEPLRGTDSRIVTGDIQNVSETLHRGVRVELEVRDAQGLKIGSLDAFINELAPHATWHVLARTSDPRAASVRVAGIKEEP